jgi:hypothetical protein
MKRRFDCSDGDDLDNIEDEDVDASHCKSEIARQTWLQ